MTEVASLAQETAQYQVVADLAGLVASVPEGSIVSRVALANAHVRTTLMGFAPGQQLTEHTSTRPALVQVLRGEVVFTLGDDEHKLTAGAALFMEAGLKHSVSAVDEVLIALTLLAKR